MKRIVYLHQYFSTPRTGGAIRSYEFAKRLVKAGHQVTVISSDSKSGNGPRGSVESIEGFTVHRIRVPYSNSMNFWQRILSFLKFAIKSAGRTRKLNADIILATSTPLTIVLPALWAIALRKNTKLLLEIRDVWPEVPIKLGYLANPILRRLSLWLEQLAYRKAHHIVALSVDMKKNIESKGIPENKVTVVTNLSDPVRFRDSKTEGLRDYPEIRNKKYLLYAGTFGHVNGLEYMVNLAAEYQKLDKEFFFVAIGEGKEKPKILKLAETVGVLGKNFMVYDSVPKEHISNLYNNAVVASSWVIDNSVLNMNSANKAFDSFASGTPLVINHEGWLADVLRESQAGLVLPRVTMEQAAKELHSFLKDKEKLARAQTQSAILGEEQFNIDVQFARLLTVVEGL